MLHGDDGRTDSGDHNWPMMKMIQSAVHNEREARTPTIALRLAHEDTGMQAVVKREPVRTKKKVPQMRHHSPVPRAILCCLAQASDARNDLVGAAFR